MPFVGDGGRGRVGAEARLGATGRGSIRLAKTTVQQGLRVQARHLFFQFRARFEKGDAIGLKMLSQIATAKGGKPARGTRHTAGVTKGQPALTHRPLAWGSWVGLSCVSFPLSLLENINGRPGKGGSSMRRYMPNAHWLGSFELFVFSRNVPGLLRLLFLLLLLRVLLKATTQHKHTLLHDDCVARSCPRLPAERRNQALPATRPSCRSRAQQCISPG